MPGSDPAGLEREAVTDGAKVEPGAPDEQSESAALGDAFERGQRRSPVLGGAEGLVGVDQVEAVMRDRRSLGRRGLGGPDVHPAVDLARVGADDLDVG